MRETEQLHDQDQKPHYKFVSKFQMKNLNESDHSFLCFDPSFIFIDFLSFALDKLALA